MRPIKPFPMLSNDSGLHRRQYGTKQGHISDHVQQRLNTREERLGYEKTAGKKRERTKSGMLINQVIPR